MVAKPSITVIIPAYNEEHFLPHTLTALQKQTFKQFDVIVVDNNSTDNTAAVARSFGARVVHEKKQGMIPARDRGFSEARTDIVLRTDADTIIPHNWVETFYTAFQTHPEIVAASGNLHLPVPFGKTIIRFYNLSCRISLGHTHMNGPNMAIRKSVWEKTNTCKDDTEVHEDIDLSIHMAEQGPLLFIPDLWVRYSMRRFKRSPLFTLFEYAFRQYKTISYHKKLHLKI